MRLDILNDNELMKLAEHQGEYNNHIMNEWHNRHQMSFPYMMIDGNIFNCLLEAVVDESSCDKMIIKQANKIRNCNE